MVNDIPHLFLLLAVILLLAKIGGIVRRFGQSAVLGELLVGVILGNLTLLGYNWFEPVKSSVIFHFLQELGVVILLFQVGLESNIQDIVRVGKSAVLVAIIGVVVPFVLGAWWLGPLIFPDLSANGYLLLGATLTATSIGITARLFKDLGILESIEAKIVLGSAVIDDVLGLMILAVVHAIITSGGASAFEVAMIATKAIGFLGGALWLGRYFAKTLGRIFRMVDSSSGMKFVMAFALCLFLSWLSSWVGLAPILGAFAAGLVLDPIRENIFDAPEFSRKLRHHAGDDDANLQQPLRDKLKMEALNFEQRHIEKLFQPIGFVTVPVFFVLTGMQVSVTVFANPTLLISAFTLTILAIFGKLVAGLGAGKSVIQGSGKSRSRVRRILIGIAMVPRGEVGLIFAGTGFTLGVFPPEVFSAIVMMIIVTTLITPIALSGYVRRAKT